jgi:hypothetical protein
MTIIIYVTAAVLDDELKFVKKKKKRKRKKKSLYLSPFSQMK